eukprot:symbB.v1.2.003775.t1/scaffold207.1/size268535/22
MYDLLGAFLAAGIYRVLRPKEFYSLSILLEDNNQESAVLGSEFIGTFYIVLTQVSCRLSGGMDLGPQAWGTAAAVIAMVCVWATQSAIRLSRNVKQKPSSCNEKLHEKMAANVAMDQPHGDGEEDSPSTDPEMPPLIPVCSNPAEPAVAPKTARQVLAAQLEVLNGRARGRGRGRKTKGKAKSESSESISAPPILVGPGTSTPGASPKTVDFSRRAGDLAAMLDQLPAPSLEENSDIPRKAKHWTDKALEEIEVTAAANAKAAASQQDELLNPADLMNADASDSEAEGEIDEDEDDEEHEGRKSTTRSRCRRPGKLNDLRELPPGAPKAESAGEEVLQAVASAGEGVAQPGGSSFGPRFKNLSKSELKVVRQKWQLHSLAGVEASSSEQNRRAAEELFAALKARRPAAAPETTADAPAAKPVFRKRSAPEAEAETSKPTHHRPDAFTTPGVRILEECVAGRGARRKADTAPSENARPAAKRRKGAS